MLQDAFSSLLLPDDVALRVCPWPDSGAISAAIGAGQLTAIAYDDAGRVVISAQALEAVVREPLWPVRAFSAERALAREATRARRYATLVPFTGYLRADHGRYTLLAMMCLRRTGASEVVLTLWSQVREAVLAAAQGEQARAGNEYAAGRDPYDTA